jgi:phosphate transport system substrate-binding protein
LTTGQADLASVSWLSEGAGASEQWSYRAFARDSLVLITHPSNPVGGLTLSQLRDIYQGKILSWADLGGPGLDVVPVSREEGSGTRLSFEALVMGGRDVAPLAVVMPSNSTVVEYVSATPAAIGYVASAWLAPSVNLLAIEGVMPSPRSIETGRYLLVRPFYLVAQLEPSGGLAEFVAWVTQGEGREVVERGYALAP